MADCNHCSLQRIRSRAKQEKKKVTLRGDRGGTSVYVHPRNVKINRLSDAERERYRASWMMELSDHCCC
ncbi:MAG: hypothetical protein Q8P76_02215 [bacterium]|nr:hypothetical protein [bacterium]